MYYEFKDANVRIAGSMHWFPPDSPNIPNWILEAYDWCEQLVVECDDPAIFSHIKLPEGQSLEKRIPPDVWLALLNLWPKTYPPLFSVKPWFVLTALPTLLNPVVIGVDQRLIQRAKTDGKPVYSLETALDVTRMLDAIPDSEYVESFSTMIGNPILYRDLAKNIHAAWLRRDLVSLFAIVSQDPLWKQASMRDTITADRSQAWIPVIQKFIPSKQRTLIVVGALHLCGKGNVTEFYKHNERHVLSIIP